MIPVSNISAEAERTSISDLPFEGYYLAPEDHAVEGLLFEGNQLHIYLTDEHLLTETTQGKEWVDYLAKLHSFPHPDLLNYSEGVRDLYLEEYDLPYDLQTIYQEITALIEPEMSQHDVQQLINNRIPGIYYTEKNEFAYYTIASPSVEEDANGLWHIELFGEKLYSLEIDLDKGVIRDQEGVIYGYLAGIKPN